MSATILLVSLVFCSLIYHYLTVERKSFEDVGKWISDARNYRGDDIMIVLVGNKLDDEDNREVSTEEGINLAKEKSQGSDEI